MTLNRSIMHFQKHDSVWCGCLMVKIHLRNWDKCLHVCLRTGLNISPLRRLLPASFVAVFYVTGRKLLPCVCVCARLCAYRSHEFTFYTKQNMSVLAQNTGLSLFVCSLTFLFHFFVQLFILFCKSLYKSFILNTLREKKVSYHWGGTLSNSTNIYNLGTKMYALGTNMYFRLYSPLRVK